MIDEYRGLEGQKRYKHVDVLKAYIQSKDTGFNNRKNVWFAVRSFYAFYRLPLPRLPRNESSRLFKPSQRDKHRAMQSRPLKVAEVKPLVLDAPQPYKAVLMVIFQSAMGLSEFTQFNSEGWRGVVERLDKAGPLRIDLFREKTSRTTVNKYYTFTGEDGKMLILEWLVMRPKTDMDTLFVTSNEIQGS